MILPGGVIGGKLPSLTRVGTHIYNSSSVTTVTFSGVSLGTSGRRTLVFMFGTVGPDATAITIGGVTATIHQQPVIATNRRACLASANVPTGSTGDIVVTFSSGSTNVRGVLYAIYNLNSSTPHASTSNTATATNFNTNVNVLNRGVIVGLAASDTSSGTGVTGLDNWTQINALPKIADASLIAAATETPRIITWTGYSSGSLAGVAASYR